MFGGEPLEFTVDIEFACSGILVSSGTMMIKLLRKRTLTGARTRFIFGGKVGCDSNFRTIDQRKLIFGGRVGLDQATVSKIGAG